MAEKRDTTAKKNGRVEPVELARTAVQAIAQMTGRRPETVLGLRREEDGWKITVEVLELSRVPNSTDLLGCYEVGLDQDGELVGYERRGRYQRGQTQGGDR